MYMYIFVRTCIQAVSYQYGTPGAGARADAPTVQTGACEGCIAGDSSYPYVDM